MDFVKKTGDKNKLFKNIKYENTQENNLFLYSYLSIPRSPRCEDKVRKFKLQSVLLPFHLQRNPHPRGVNEVNVPW
jgi:hypothetical protein